MNELKNVITIAREYGSGGHEIGKLLAEKLGIPFYDKEVLTLAAKESGICEELFVDHDEKAHPSYLFSLVTGATIGGAFAAGQTQLPLNHRIFMAQFEAVTRLASNGPCVIVGRCADYVLRDLPNVLHLFLYADVESRIRRIMQVEGLTHDKAKENVRKTDKQRQAYYNFYANGNWGQRSNYDLMLRTDSLTSDSAADFLKGYVLSREINS